MEGYVIRSYAQGYNHKRNGKTIQVRNNFLSQKKICKNSKLRTILFSLQCCMIEIKDMHAIIVACGRFIYVELLQKNIYSKRFVYSKCSKL